MYSLELGLSTLALVAALVRRMLKTLVIPQNISHALLNIIKGLISAMFKDSFPSQCLRSQHSYFLFCSPITATSRFNFCSLALSVWVVSWYVSSIEKSLFTERLRIILVIAILSIALFISESPLGNNPVTMPIL